MSDVAIAPDEVDRLADLLAEKATETLALRKVAASLGMGSAAGTIAGVIDWAEGAARLLRLSADIARRGDQADLSLESLTVFGLPLPTGVSAERGGALLLQLQALLADETPATPEERAAAVKATFAQMTPQETAWLAAAAPDVVGGLDGAPNNARFAANRTLIGRQLEEDRARLAAMPADDNDQTRSRLEQRIERLEGFLQPGAAAHQDPVTGLQVEGSPRQFLLFDGSGDGKAAEVLGDLDTARSVGVMVPGITNRLDNFDSLVKAGMRLQDSADVRTGGGNAVVVWLGYDTPELGDSPVPDAGEVAGPALHSFRAGLNTAAGARVTLLAHSYGTFASSKAIQGGADFNAVVFMGSPGLGSDVDSMSDLNPRPRTEVFVMRAPGDYVSYTQAHGHDPAEFSDATRLATNVGDSHQVFGHSDYYLAETPGGDAFAQSSESLKNLTRVMTGDTGSLSTTDTDLGDESWWGGPERGVVGMLNHSPDVAKRHLGWVDGEIAADTEDVKDFLQDVREEREIWKDTYDTASDWVGDRVDTEIAADKKALQDAQQALREEGEIWEDRYDTTKGWVDDHVPDLNPFD